MQVNKITAFNFASYKQIEIDLANRGLTLVHGATGSGKSTICDLIPWALFGRTAKGGNADEILSWPGNEVCKVICELGDIKIVRTRGPKSKDNDLYIAERKWQGQIIRGKDIPDTQKKINELLGIDYELYLSGAYFHEFSQTAQFFITTAKNRRAICEQIVDLSLPKKVQVNLKADKKVKNELLTEITKELGIAQYEEGYLTQAFTAEHKKIAAWDKTHVAKVADLNEKHENFEQDKAIKLSVLSQEHDAQETKRLADINQLIMALNELEATTKSLEFYKEWGDRLKRLRTNHKFVACPTCGGDKDHKFLDKLKAEENEWNEKRLKDAYNVKDIERYKEALKSLQRPDTTYADAVKAIKATTNTYGEQLDALLDEENPYIQTANDLKKKLDAAILHKAGIEMKVNALKTELADMDLLADITENFRGIAVKNTIVNIEQKVNDILATYFDAEIKVEFAVEQADKVEVTITKDGNICQYTQLSKGQRKLLNLSFGLAVMDYISQYHNVNFQQIFLDEALDGLDEAFKAKAYNLLKSLESQYGSIFVVEHSENMRELFDNKIKVELVNGESVIEKS